MAVEVTVVVPMYNEERYIASFIESLTKQTFPTEKMEWIFVDGDSTDGTVAVVKEYVKGGIYPITLLRNEKRKTPYALNLAIKQARGKYIIRFDVHSYFYPDYIEKCVHYLNTTDADNVGGIAETEATTPMGKTIAEMLSSPFGVGNSNFRINHGDCYVDTVPFGAYRREIFEKVGLFNTELPRSEDNDMNSRIRESGGKIWLAEDIRFKYYCRDTVKSILLMALQNGNALFFTVKQNPKAMRVRHFIPFCFLLSVLLLPFLAFFSEAFALLFALEMIAYLSLDIFFSFAHGNKRRGLIKIWLYPMFHLTYGVGSLLGLLHKKLY
jgi:glycosyltransferase involved in cell wall biosynthesis